ncbi:MAG: hypothetical protein H6742_01415 [Alphaproteobacteria bacterium]|nr:hypothetical protein [Alphaproteobacteria bacterium]
MTGLALYALIFTASAGKKSKTTEEAPPPPPPPAVEEDAADDEAMDEATPEEPPAPAPVVPNVDLTVTLTFGDGSSKAGHVVRIERSEDFYGEEGWLDDAKKLVVEGEAGTTLEMKPWATIKSVTVTPGKVPADVSCTYSTEMTPWMYDCTLKTPTKMVTSDGKTWTVANRHKWRFFFDDDTEVEFWLAKHSAREQDETVVDIYTENPENYDLYAKLQERLKNEVKGEAFVTRVVVGQ